MHPDKSGYSLIVQAALGQAADRDARHDKPVAQRLPLMCRRAGLDELHHLVDLGDGTGQLVPACLVDEVGEDDRGRRLKDRTGLKRRALFCAECLADGPGREKGENVHFVTLGKDFSPAG